MKMYHQTYYLKSIFQNAHHWPGYKLVSALTTHHHMDHSGGNEKLASMYPGIPFYGGDDRIPALSHKVKHDDVIKIGRQCWGNIY